MSYIERESGDRLDGGGLWNENIGGKGKAKGEPRAVARRRIGGQIAAVGEGDLVRDVEAKSQSEGSLAPDIAFEEVW